MFVKFPQAGPKTHVKIPTNNFQYPALDVSQPHVRLFRLLPKVLKWGTIRVELWNNVNLNVWRLSGGHPRYYALSYEWGPPEPKRLIVVNGKRLWIRQNLVLFLDSLYEGHGNIENRWLWADAICIDQENVLERNHSVHQMKDVYSQASQVLAWLGPCQSDVEEDLFLIFEHMNLESSTSVSRYKECFRDEFYCGNRLPKSLRRLSERYTNFSIFYQFYLRSYWQRIWVLQELILGREVLVLSGQHSARFDIVLQFFHRHFQLNPDWSPRRLLLTPFYKIFSFLRKQDRLPTENSLSLLRVLQELMGANCTIPHDKVYGLLGIANRGAQSLIVDYNISLERSYINVLESASESCILEECFELTEQLGMMMEFATAETVLLSTQKDQSSGDSMNSQDTLKPLVATSVAFDVSSLAGCASGQVFFWKVFRPSPNSYHAVLDSYRRVLEGSSCGDLVCRCPPCQQGTAVLRRDLCPEGFSDESHTVYQINIFEWSRIKYAMHLPDFYLIFRRDTYVSTFIRFFSTWDLHGTDSSNHIDRENWFREHSIALSDPNSLSWKLRFGRYGQTTLQVPIRSVLFLLAHLFPIRPSVLGVEEPWTIWRGEKLVPKDGRAKDRLFPFNARLMPQAVLNTAMPSHVDQ